MKIKIAGILAFLVVSLSCTSMRKSLLPAADELRPRGSPLQAGEIAPDFTLEDQHNQKVTLSSSRGKMPAVLVFYRGYW